MRNIYDLNGVAKQLLTCGVRKDANDKFVIDFSRDYPNDILNLVGPELLEDEEGSRVYWFGYEFNGHVKDNTRGEFIKYLKRFGKQQGISENDLRRLITRPISALNTKISSYNMDCLICPRSGRSNLVGKIKDAILKEVSNSADLLTYDDVIEMEKLKEKDIEIDWNKFDLVYADNRNRTRYENILLQKEYEWKGSNNIFSISRSFPDGMRELRKFIKNYIVFPDKRTEEKFLAMEKPNILVIDDTLTSGSTIREIINALTSHKANNSIYIYTLLNNRH